VKATIGIATRNRAEQLGLCLASIQARKYEDIEIVLVDDDSSDGTAKVLEEFGGLLSYTRKIGRQGGFRRNPSDVLNMVHALASSGIVIEQGGEVCHLTDCVNPLVEACEPGRVALARVHNGTPVEMEALRAEIASGRYVFPEDVEPNSVQTDGSHWPVPRVGITQVQLYCGAERPAPFLFCGAIHQVDFEAVAGYDPTIPCNNDGDLARRLQERGVRFRFIGRAIAFHLKHSKT
jgi:GT2 family glycosyltransferase